jgi:hypothetical protein
VLTKMFDNGMHVLHVQYRAISLWTNVIFTILYLIY